MQRLSACKGVKVVNADWLRILEQPEYEWEYRTSGATEHELHYLQEWLKRPLPEDYVAFMRMSNGAVLWYEDIWHLQIWSVGDVKAWTQQYGFSEKMPGAIALGDNGGGEGLIFDTRPQHSDGLYPILAVNFVTINWQETLPVASSFRDLLLLRHSLLDK